MKKIKGRIFAVLLATTVITGGIATSALAAETESESKIVVMEAEQSASAEQSVSEEQSAKIRATVNSLQWQNRLMSLLTKPEILHI